MRTPLVLAALAALASQIKAQEAVDRGAIVIYRGADTVVTDRFIRSGDTLQGIVQVKGQPRVEYLARLGPDETVRSLTLGVVPNGSSVPAQQIRLTMKGDSIIAETSTGVHRLPAQAGAIPMFNNALALGELFTRRARLTGGVANIPYFATNGGATIDVQVRPISTDSMSVTIARQVERFKVDSRGRILGGVIVGSRTRVRPARARGCRWPGRVTARLVGRPEAGLFSARRRALQGRGSSRDRTARHRPRRNADDADERARTGARGRDDHRIWSTGSRRVHPVRRRNSTVSPGRRHAEPSRHRRAAPRRSRPRRVGG